MTYLQSASLKILIVLFLCLPAAAQTTAKQVMPTVYIEVLADRPEAVYKTGETITFQVRTLTCELKGNQAIQAKDASPVPDVALKYQISRDGVVISNGTLTSAQNAVAISVQADQPGFYQCSVQEQTMTRSWQYKGAGGAAVDPEKIKAGVTMPDDFNAFWERTLAELKTIAFDNVEMIPYESQSLSDMQIFKVKIPSLGAGPDKVNPHVTGAYIKPVNAQPRSHPAILRLPGAGIRDVRVSSYKINALEFSLNAHGLELDQPKSYYQDMRNPIYELYANKGETKEQALEQSYYRVIILRVIRALEFLEAQPEWDGKTLIVSGSSQGGGLSIIAAGLHPRVTACVAGVPGFCDQYGYLVGRENGWPKMIKFDKEGKPVSPLQVEIAAYFDAANFARRIKPQTDVLLSVGFLDPTCPPGSIYAAYNLIASPHRQIIHGPNAGHQGPPLTAGSFIQAHVEKMKQSN